MKDIDPSLLTSGYQPQYVTEMNGVAYFSGRDAQHGAELWRSDGTADGTYLVKDLLAGNSYPSNLTNVAGTLYFVAGTSSGRELWKSDGTAAGTFMVLDAYAGSGSLFADGVDPEFTVSEGIVYFRASAADQSVQLWKTDGTAAGTTLVRSVGTSGLQMLSELTAFDGGLYFVESEVGSVQSRLWRTDGTAVGTIPIDHPIGNVGSIRGLTVFDDELYFMADDGSHGYELWKTDGTAANMGMVVDLRPGSAGSYPQSLAVFNGALVFNALVTGVGVYRLEAESSEPVRQNTIESGSLNNGLTVAGGSLYYTVGDSIWRSAGEVGDAVVVATIPGASSFDSLTTVGSTVYFAAQIGSQKELWATDGTTAGTRSFAGNINQESGRQFAVLGDAVLFARNYAGAGLELWRSEGTPATTVIVADRVEGMGSKPTDLVQIGDEIFFSTSVGLWKTDGTTGGTVLVKSLMMGGYLAQVSTQVRPMGGYAVAFNGELYFVARGLSGPTANIGYELWKSDGTEAGTVLVKNINAAGDGFLTGASLGNVPAPYFTQLGNELFFRAYDATRGLELWKSDGTEAGTVLVKDIYPGTGSGFSIQTNVYNDPSFVVFNGALYFAASQNIFSHVLWKTDGTTAGTVQVSFGPGATPSTLGIAEFDGNLYLATTASSGRGIALWHINGANGSVALLKTIDSFGSNSSIEFEVFGSRLYFSCIVSFAGELWSTDGTPTGTVRLVQSAGIFDSSPWLLTAVDDTLFFTRSNSELWKTDGTIAGTVLVKQISAGYLGGSENTGAHDLSMANIGGRLYFLGNGELWTSDGTNEGTELVDDVSGPDWFSSPAIIRELNGRLLVVASSERTGAELWVGDLPGAPAPGDFDRNGLVNGDDFLRWQRTLGATVTPAGAGADGDGDGGIDGDDLAVWRATMAPPEIAVAVTRDSGDRNVTPAVARGARAESTPTTIRDELFASGDLTAMFTGRTSFRPAGRGRGRTGR